MSKTPMTIEEMIADVTGLAGDGDIVSLAARRLKLYWDKAAGCQMVEWWFEKDGRCSDKVTLPQGTFTWYREQPMVGFWLVDIPRPTAERHGVTEFAIDRAEADEIRERLIRLDKEWTKEKIIAWRKAGSPAINEKVLGSTLAREAAAQVS